MADEIGGYFARLRLIVDQEDFNQGVRSLSMLTMEVKQTSDKTVTAKDSWKDFMVGLGASIYVIKNVAAALKDMYGAMADTNKQTFAISNAAAGMGMGTKETTTMLNAGNIAGISEKTMLASMQDMSGKMGAIMTGNLSVAQGTAMGVLGLGIDTEKDKKAPAILSDIVNAALKQARALDPGERDYQSKLESKRVWATQAGGDTAGAFFDYLMNPNSSIHTMGALLAAGANSNTFEEARSKGDYSPALGATKFSENKAILDNETKGLKQDLYGDVGESLSKLLKKLADALKINEPIIEDAIHNLADIIQAFADFMGLFIPKKDQKKIDRAKAGMEADNALRSVGINPALKGWATGGMVDTKLLLADPLQQLRWYINEQEAGGPYAREVSPPLHALYDKMGGDPGSSGSYINQIIEAARKKDPVQVELLLRAEPGTSAKVTSKSGNATVDNSSNGVNAR
jgi:hypothetical protein